MRISKIPDRFWIPVCFIVMLIVCAICSQIPVVKIWRTHLNKISDKCNHVCGDRGVMVCEDTRVRCGNPWEEIH
jgi:hypothetical protein